MTQRAPLVAILLLVSATSTPVFAQTPSTPDDRDPFIYLFHNLVRDAKRLPSVETAITLGAGGGLALAVHPADDTVYELATTTFQELAVLANGTYPTTLHIAGGGRHC